MTMTNMPAEACVTVSTTGTWRHNPYASVLCQECLTDDFAVSSYLSHFCHSTPDASPPAYIRSDDQFHIPGLWSQPASLDSSISGIYAIGEPSPGYQSTVGDDDNGDFIIKVSHGPQTHDYASKTDYSVGELVIVEGDRGLLYGSVIASSPSLEPMCSTHSVVRAATCFDEDQMVEDRRVVEAVEHLLATSDDDAAGTQLSQLSIIHVSCQLGCTKIMILYDGPTTVRFNPLSLLIFRHLRRVFNVTCRVWFENNGLPACSRMAHRSWSTQDKATFSRETIRYRPHPAS
jgi:hypothetical protein